MQQDNPSDYVARVTHDLKSPLNAILGFIEILRQDLASSTASPQALSNLDMIENIANDMQVLISNMLVSARIQAGKEAVLPSIIEKNVLVARIDSLRRTFEAEALSRKVNFSVEAKQLPEFVYWDIQKIRYFAVNNLIANALKFVGEGGMVKVTVDVEENQMVSIAVADNGPGIPANERESIFEQFTQASNNPNRWSGGGFGLFNAAHVVHEHHGDISVKAGIDGKGVTFEIRIPTVPFPMPDQAQDRNYL